MRTLRPMLCPGYAEPAHSRRNCLNPFATAVRGVERVAKSERARAQAWRAPHGPRVARLSTARTHVSFQVQASRVIEFLMLQVDVRWLRPLDCAPLSDPPAPRLVAPGARSGCTHATSALAGTGHRHSAPSTSATSLGSIRPHLHRDRARPCCICTRTGLAPATSVP
jgi:hypothetical protein